MTTAERLRELLSYDPDTGLFIWREGRGGLITGSLAGARVKKGYILISIDDIMYRAHRLAWLYVNGEWPIDQLDHINGDPSDNRIANLRQATASQNNANKGAYSNNKSGFAGVCWHKEKGRWQAKIGIHGRKRFLGYFDDPAEAHAVYVKAAGEAFGEFMRGNK